MGEAAGHLRGAGSDEELAEAVAQAAAGDEPAFLRMYREVHPMLVTYLQALVGAGAEHVTSHAWHDVVHNLHRFRGDGEAFRGWIAEIARRRALEHLPSGGGIPHGAIGDEVATGTVDQEIRKAEGPISTAQALVLIAQLPQEEAEAVLLRVVFRLGTETAAQVLGLRPGAVRTSARRGLERLSERLDGRETNR